ncbi:S-layer homology domain-containing protein [Intestinimonas butyriciproducens]|uniref:S-layer homology domain-containing protein n=1 Tax=Intestinimonas butyriciproducens TaxID=1297617 RepID=UPI003AF0954D
MAQLRKRSISLLLAVILMLSLCVPAMAATEKDITAAVTKSAEYMLSSVKTPQVGSIGGEWAVIGLARSGYSVPQEYWDSYYATVEDYVESCKGVLHKKKYTEYSRVTVALSAIGADPTDVAGYDLLKPLGDFEMTIWQGINGPIWALIALDSGNYEIPVNAEATTQATRQMYIDEILRRQLDDGGWNLTDEGGSGRADPDITGMALQALAKYQDQAAVKTATDKALKCLSKMQDSNGGFASWGTANSESVVQVIVALCELGIDIEDSRFVKNSNTLLDNLMTYRNADGSFRHTADGSGSNQMAAEQGFYGIVAVMRAMQGKNSLYRMSDCGIRVSGNAGVDNTIGLPGKHADVKKTTITAPGTTFADISAHANQPAVEALASRGIISGYNAESFGPNDTMTRAQFATIVVRALGLPLAKTDNFTDVKADAWYASFVGTAYTYGIVNGTSATNFNPDGTITRQEAAVMVARAAKLCGMDTDLETYEILNVLAQFGDYVTIGEWARESMAFCYGEDILDQSDLDVEPKRAILRCEIAQMLYNLLGSAKLL